MARKTTLRGRDTSDDELRRPPGRPEGVQGRSGERGKLAQWIGVLGGEVGAARLIGQLQEAVSAAIFPTDRGGQPSPHRRVGRGLIAEALPGGMGFGLGLGQPHHLARRQVQAMEPAARGSTR
jgi:hypothetical protein